MEIVGDLYVKLGKKLYVPVTMNTKDVDKLQASKDILLDALWGIHDELEKDGRFKSTVFEIGKVLRGIEE